MVMVGMAATPGSVEQSAIPQRIHARTDRPAHPGATKPLRELGVAPAARVVLVGHRQGVLLADQHLGPAAVAQTGPRDGRPWGDAAEGGVGPIQALISLPPHVTQGMGLGDPLLGGDLEEQGTGSILLAAHLLSAVKLSAVQPFPRD